MKYIYLPISAMILAFTACKKNQDVVHEHPEVHAETGQLEIPLNDGQKWKMDDHTRSMFVAMTERVKAGGDAAEVGKGLKSDLDQLIQGCTMEGAAHDQLHVYLVSFIPAVEKAASTGSPESLKKAEDLLSKYPQYFE